MPIAHHPHSHLLLGFPVPPDDGLPTLAVFFDAVRWSLPATAVILALCLSAVGDLRKAFWSAACAKAVSTPLAPTVAWMLSAIPVLASGRFDPAGLAFVRMGPHTPTAALAAVLFLFPAAYGVTCVAVEWAVLRRLGPARPGLLMAVARANLYGSVVLLSTLGADILTGDTPADDPARLSQRCCENRGTR